MGVSNKVNNKYGNTRKKRSDSDEVSIHSRSETKLSDDAPIILTWVPKEKGRSLPDENLQIVIDHINKYRETRKVLLCINSSGFESEQKEAIRQKLDERLGDKAQQVEVIDLLEYDWSSVDQGWKIDSKDISIKDYYANMYSKAPGERMYFPVELDNFRMVALALSEQITGKRGAIYVDFDTLSAIKEPLGQDITIPKRILVGDVDENFVNNDLIAIDRPEVVIDFLNRYNYKIESEKMLCRKAKEILNLNYDGTSLNELLEMHAKGNLNKALYFLFYETRFLIITHLAFDSYIQYLAKLQHDDPYDLAKSLSFEHNGGKYPDDSKAFHNYSWLDIPSRKIREERLKIEEYISLAKKEEASKGIRELANYIQSIGYKFETEMTTFLHLAMRIQDKSLVKDLIEMGDDVNARDSHGKTLLHLAAEMGDLSLVSLLLKNGAVSNVQNIKMSMTKSSSKSREILTLLTNVEQAFHLASGGISVVRLTLLKQAIEDLSDVQVLVKAKSEDGRTLLSLVVSRKSNLLEVQEKRLEIIDLLVDKGADINFKDAQENSLLYIAIRNTDKEVVGALLKKGAVIDDATKLIVKGMKAIPNPNEDIKAILEKLERHRLRTNGCAPSGSGRGKRAAGGECEITDEMKLEAEGRVVPIESIGSIFSNLNRRILERLRIKSKVVNAAKNLLSGNRNAIEENINDIELLLKLQNSYLDSVPSAIDLHRSKNRHNGAVLDAETEQQLNRLESKALEGIGQNAHLLNSITALKVSVLAFEKIREIKERLNPELLKDLSGEKITSLIDSELEKVEVVKKEFTGIIESNLEHIVRTVISNKFDQEIQRVNKKVSDIQSFASLMQEIDRFDSRKESLYESARSMNSEGIIYGKKINDLRDELFSNIVGLIDDFNNLKLDPNLIRQAPDFIKERVKVFKSDISYLKSVKAEVSATKSFSIDELFDYISPSIRDDRTIGESLELRQVVMSYKRLRAVTYFLENGFDVNTRDSHGRTFLHLAAEMGSDESLISLLLEKGAMFDAKDNDGKSPLDLLRTNAIKLDTGGVELLESIERAFNFVSRGDFDSVDNLLKESSEDYIRALVKVRNSSGNTLLYEAIAKEQANQENQVKIIDLLIKNGAADGLQGPNGKSTLYVAIKNKGEKIIDFLLEKGAVVDAATIEFAKQNSNEVIVKKLEKHILGEFTQCSSGSSRVKREVSGDCISWEDIDEFNEEKNESRNPEKIKINSEKFLDYLKEVQGEKRSALLELVNKVGEERVAGKFQDVINKLTSSQKAMEHLNKVARVSDALMRGMMYKSLLGALSRGDLKGVATSSGFIVLSHVSGKISEAAYSKGVALMIDGKVLMGRLSKIGGSVAGHIFVPFIVYSAVEDGIACKKVIVILVCLWGAMSLF